MRTTLNIAEDVLLAVKERARRQSRTAGDVLSDLARESLTRCRPPQTANRELSFYGFDPLPHRGEAVSNELIDRLREEED